MLSALSVPTQKYSLTLHGFHCLPTNLVYLQFFTLAD
uniref:Uncharacterized protein n=1 Tax=Arundo donax TaxID=35708 RepID=A0A0A8YAR9_ARUDO